jgi:hypothetical protein
VENDDAVQVEPVHRVRLGVVGTVGALRRGDRVQHDVVSQRDRRVDGVEGVDHLRIARHLLPAGVGLVERGAHHDEVGASRDQVEAAAVGSYGSVTIESRSPEGKAA